MKYIKIKTKQTLTQKKEEKIGEKKIETKKKIDWKFVEVNDVKRRVFWRKNITYCIFKNINSILPKFPKRPYTFLSVLQKRAISYDLSI